jgi:hypothetical protein
MTSFTGLFYMYVCIWYTSGKMMYGLATLAAPMSAALPLSPVCFVGLYIYIYAWTCRISSYNATRLYCMHYYLTNLLHTLMIIILELLHYCFTSLLLGEHLRQWLHTRACRRGTVEMAATTLRDMEECGHGEGDL